MKFQFHVEGETALHSAGELTSFDYVGNEMTKRSLLKVNSEDLNEDIHMKLCSGIIWIPKINRRSVLVSINYNNSCRKKIKKDS